LAEGKVPLDKTITIGDESPTYRTVFDEWTTGANYSQKEGFKDYFAVENDVLYEIKQAYSINSSGLLCRLSGSYANASQIDYNYNKYCSNLEHEFFTRYKFTNSNLEKEFNFNEISGWTKSLDEETGETEYYKIFESNHQTTYFAEVVKVSFGGIGKERKVYHTTKNEEITVTAGYIQKYKE
ncbi:MAG: hypothetical protein IKY10_04020, partial [Clostridia bacterium]|nr:hypothetical protein [Clostridia bacterium]